MPSDDELMDDLSLSEEDVEETDDVEEVEDPDGEDAGEGDVEEPEDLAAAFAAVQRAGKGEPAGDLDGVGDRGDPGDNDAPVDDEPYEAVEDDRQDSDGGPGDAYSGASYQAISQQLSHEASQVAMRQAVSEMRKQGIRPFTMNDLYERDERAGRVIYHNPDDKSRPFASRMEAQQWIDSFNSQLMEETKRRAQEIYRDVNKAIMPSRRLLAFAPKYDSMSADVREVFDDLIEGYEITNAGGEVIGYSCDLDKAMVRAERMAAKYASKSRQPKAQRARRQPSEQPATDMRSHGTKLSEGRGVPDEPKTLEEAFRIMREQRKAGK